MDRVVKQSNYTDTGSKNQDLEDHFRMIDKDLDNIFDYSSKYPTPNVSPEISSGAGVPLSTPKKIGNMYIDTTNNKVYISTATTSSSSWKILN
jgi:hypothetical protein